MTQQAQKQRPARSDQRSGKRTDPRAKKCSFCVQKIDYIDYKDYPTMKPLVDYFGNIMKRYYTGTCLKHQKRLRNAVERARFMGFLAYRK